jgi:hypothetical protein
VGGESRGGTLPRMARHGPRARLNRTVRWSATILCVVAILVYTLGLFRVLAFQPGIGRLSFAELDRGQVVVRWDSVPYRLGPWQLHSSPVAQVRHGPWAQSLRVGWSRTTRPNGSFTYMIFFPFWVVLACCLPLAIVAWIVHAKAGRRAGACPCCNYDLSGLPPGSPCPECAAVHDR